VAAWRRRAQARETEAQLAGDGAIGGDDRLYVRQHARGRSGATFELDGIDG